MTIDLPYSLGTGYYVSSYLTLIGAKSEISEMSSNFNLVCFVYFYTNFFEKGITQPIPPQTMG